MNDPSPLPAAGAPAMPAPGAVHKTDVGSVFVSNYPPFSVWRQEAQADYRRALEMPPAEGVPLGLYLHVPFCRKRCKFCYFRVYVDKNAEQVQAYLENMAREVELYAQAPAFAGRPVSFVYFGGGTPSYVAVKHLEGLLSRVKAVFPWDNALEVAFECEPGTLTEPKVKAYREMGITRLSLGVESWNDEILRENGRAHVTKEIDRCVSWIKDAGFRQLNIDLIAGMVGENWPSWKDSVARTIELEPDSVTIYQMELPFNTVYSQGILAGETESPVADWETKRAWHAYAIDKLEEAGYEVSSAYTMVRKASAERRFLYRDALWRGADMIGAGVSSFGHLHGVHMQNVASWSEYMGALEAGEMPFGRAYKATVEERFVRELILQTKLGKLPFDYFRQKFGIDPLQRFGEVYGQLQAEGLVESCDAAGMRLTRQGLLQVDALLPRFYAPQYRNSRYT
jgi:oxygen-independent coproporphyrinogen III oxidase